MNQIIMDAFSELIKSAAIKARTKGFDILILMLAICGLIFWIFRLDARIEDREHKFDIRVDSMAKEFGDKLNFANERIKDCERDKYDLSLRVAVLEFTQARVKLKLK